VAGRALERLGISREQVRQQATQDQQQAGPVPEPHPARGVIQPGAGEAAARCGTGIGTGHFLLALFRAEDQTAARAHAGRGEDAFLRACGPGQVLGEELLLSRREPPDTRGIAAVALTACITLAVSEWPSSPAFVTGHTRCEEPG
jgi:hypothetical protein